MNAAPNKVVRCPCGNHRNGDIHPSLHVLADDRRVIGFSPICLFHNNGRGMGSWQLARLAHHMKERNGG